MSGRVYITDLKGVEWGLVEPYVRTSGYGRPPLHRKRAVLNALFYQLRAGGAWHLMPHELPPWCTVYKQVAAWREDGTWDKLLAALRRHVRHLSRDTGGRGQDADGGFFHGNAVVKGPAQ
ncbi:transposase [Hymenobacter terrenus]|uniref:transposase n=1 Tax=Hymenobacter terrenus TaxID=1629124 RepID=UPI0012E011BC